jgi:hypothetical protein
VYGLNTAQIYDHLAARISGKEDLNQNNQQILTEMIQKMVSVNVPNAKYTKGAGWHHWIINGDMPRGANGTNKTYIGVQYHTLAQQVDTVWQKVLENLVSNQYKGQIKIAADPQYWLSRMDNIVLHSGSQEWAQFGANIVKKVFDHFNVKTGGLATTGAMEQGLDIKGTNTSFNHYAAQVAERDIHHFLKGTRDYAHFARNVQNHFSPNGGFVTSLKQQMGS